MEDVMDIGEVCARTGLRPSTLRYYEARGLIASAARQGLRRQFSSGVLLRLTLISMGRAAGFSLDEIAGIFRADGAPELPRERLRQKADELERRIKRLEHLRDTLRHVAQCPAPTHMACPTFRRLVERAGRQDAGGAGAARRRRVVTATP